MKLLFVWNDDFLCYKTSTFSQLKQNERSRKHLAPNSKRWKIDILERLLTMQADFSDPWFLRKFHLWVQYRKFCTRRNFESLKKPKIHAWKQVLILNLNSKAHFHNYVCYLQELQLRIVDTVRIFCLNLCLEIFTNNPQITFKGLQMCIVLWTHRDKKRL